MPQGFLPDNAAGSFFLIDEATGPQPQLMSIFELRRRSENRSQVR